MMLGSQPCENLPDEKSSAPMKSTLSLTAMLILSCGLAFAGESRKISEQELVRRTQELFDAVAGGDRTPWQKYYADDAIYSDEKGRVMDKTALVKDISPLPKGYSGTIHVQNVKSSIVGDVAILSYDADESETVFGQQLHARYRQTDTWLFRGGQWRIIASQAHRYYEDPAVGEIDPKLLDSYVGTYELAPGIRAVVSREGDKLFHERTGRAKVELLPESCGIFFRKGVEGRILFHVAENGVADTLIDRRNNEDIRWKRVR